MESVFQKVADSGLSRRAFMGACAAGMAGLAMAGCSSETTVAETDKDPADLVQGEWKTVGCLESCGGKCLNRAYFVDGIAVRQKTDDTHPDSPEYPQQRGCARGRAQRKGVFASDRLKYPMKRKGWQPGGGENSNGQMRGLDEWERISWDEAAELIVQEVKRLQGVVGPEGIYMIGIKPLSLRTIGMLGGCSMRGMATGSYGTWTYCAQHLGLEPHPNVRPTIGYYGEFFARDGVNDRFDATNSDLVVLWGMNTTSSNAGSVTWSLTQIKHAGAKFISIDPHYNDTQAALEADWIPVRPATDIALMIGVAYAMLEADDPESNPLIDWDFLNRCTVGFDAEHMPEGADPKDNFKDYCLGTYDGVPKTPEWASEICGVDPARIRQLAEELGMGNKVTMYCSWGPARTDNASHWPQMFMTLGAMGGHFGKSGHSCGCRTGHQSGSPGMAKTDNGNLWQPGYDGTNFVIPGCPGIPSIDLWNAFLTKEAVVGRDADGNDVTIPSDVRMLYVINGAPLTCFEDVVNGIAAFRSLDFVVVQDIKFTFTARYADIVLPVASAWEQTIVVGDQPTQRELFFAHRPAVERYYEAKTDDEIDVFLGEKAGFTALEVLGVASEDQAFYNKLSTTKVLNGETYEYENLLTITQEDIDGLGVEGAPQEGRIPYAEFIEKGMYQIETKPGDSFGYIAYEEFRNDPEANPINSASGKFEIYSQGLADYVNSFGYDHIKPYPTYDRPLDGYEASFSDWENKVKGEYPVQAFTTHYIRRSHSTFDTIYELREAFQAPVFINSVDAAERGIAQGDTVLIYNQAGKMLRLANVTERIMPGVIMIPHGQYGDIDEETGVDRGGNENVLTRRKFTSTGMNGYNTCLVQFEKYDGEPIPFDHEKPRIDVDALIGEE